MAMRPKPQKKVLLDEALDAQYRAMHPPCTECGSDKYTRFRYFNNKTAMLKRAMEGKPMNPQGRFACRSPECLKANPGKIEVEFTNNGKKRPNPYVNKRKAPQDSNISMKKQAKMPYPWQQQQQVVNYGYNIHNNNTIHGQMPCEDPATSNYHYYYYDKNGSSSSYLDQTYGNNYQQQQQYFQVPEVVMGIPVADNNINCCTGYPIMAMGANSGIYYNYSYDAAAAAAATDTSFQTMEPPTQFHHDQSMPPLVDDYDAAAFINTAPNYNYDSTIFMDPLVPAAAVNDQQQHHGQQCTWRTSFEFLEQEQQQQQADAGVKLAMLAELLEEDSTVEKDEDPATFAAAEETAAALAALIDSHGQQHQDDQVVVVVQEESESVVVDDDIIDFAELLEDFISTNDTEEEEDVVA